MPAPGQHLMRQHQRLELPGAPLIARAGGHAIELERPHQPNARVSRQPLQALRRTLSPLHVPAAPMPVFAEHLKKEYDTYKKQNPQEIADTSAAPEILDRAIAFVSRFSETDFQSQRFLGGGCSECRRVKQSAMANTE
jgi:hypothetical protein